MPITTLERAETQVNGYNRERKRKLCDLFAQSGDLLGSLQVVGVSLDTHYHHCGSDEWYAREVAVAKRMLAWSLVPRQRERALANSTSDAIWLQKVLGGAEFRPDAKPAVQITGNVSIGFGTVPRGTPDADSCIVDIPPAPTRQPSTTPRRKSTVKKPAKRKSKRASRLRKSKKVT